MACRQPLMTTWFDGQPGHSFCARLPVPQGIAEKLACTPLTLSYSALLSVQLSPLTQRLSGGRH
jgi:hypothetical protein